MTTRRWVRVCSLWELEPGRGVAALVDGRQVAVFLLPGLPGASGTPDGREPAVRLRAIDNHDPATGANVLSRGLLGSTGDVDYVASPMRKHRYDLDSGRCLDGAGSVPGVRVWPVRSWGATVEVLSVVGETAEAVRTHCPFCALQCGMRVRGSGGGVTIESDPSFPVNEGRMCVKGWASAGLIGHPDRLTSPLLRDTGGVLQPVSWDEALSYVADRIAGLQSSSGRDSVGVFGSGALTNEKAYLLGKFARVALGTANIDYNGRFCMSSAAAAQNRAFGVDRGLPFPVADVARTGGLVLWGSNPADTMPPLMEWVQRMQSAGGTFAVVDPRSTATAEMADLHVQPVPGTDLAVALGLLRLADARGLVDVSYVATRTTGWSSVRDAVEDWTPERVEEVSGVTPGLLGRLLDVLAGPPSSMLISGRGPEQQSKGVDTVTALINLMLVLGRVGRPASGYGCLTGQANGQGGREHGQKADQLPGYRSIADPADRAAVAVAWGVDPSTLPGPGLSAVEMVDSIGRPGGVRGLLVFGSDLATASPSGRRTASQLGILDLLVVADSMMSATAAAADVVLPVAQWAEEDGTVTNLEGRVIRRRRAVAPPAGVMTDLEVIDSLASRLGVEGFSFAGPEAVFEELRQATAGAKADYSRITYSRIDEEQGVHWGSPRMFADRFEHPDGRARMHPVSYRPVAEPPDQAYPLFLTTGRYREHYNSGTQTRRLSRLVEASPEPRLQLHPALAESLGVADGDPVRVESRRGSASFAAEITPSIRRDTVFAPFHWSGHQSANLLTISALDPVSRMPEFKICAVRIRPG